MDTWYGRRQKILVTYHNDKGREHHDSWGDGGDDFEHRRYLITQHKRLVLKYRWLNILPDKMRHLAIEIGQH